MAKERTIMLNRMRWGNIRAFGMLMGYLNMTGRTIVQRGINNRAFLLSKLKRWLKSLERISVEIKMVNRANSIAVSKALPNLIVLSYFTHSEDTGQNSLIPPPVM